MVTVISNKRGVAVTALLHAFRGHDPDCGGKEEKAREERARAHEQSQSRHKNARKPSEKVQEIPHTRTHLDVQDL